MTTAGLVAATSVPREYASKVTGALARRGWVEARRGAGGGFLLVEHNLTLLDVVELFEGPIRMHVCTGPTGCQFSTRCPVHKVWLHAEIRVRKLLAEHRIADLAASSREQELFVPKQGKMVAAISGPM